MNKEELIKKSKKYLESNFIDSSDCCENHIKEWIEAVMLFRSKTKSACCQKTLRELQHFILQESSSTDYIVRKNAMFGDLVQIRSQGFENRYLKNTKLFKTYKKAYEKTEFEYIQTFGKRRYSSYDSFRQIRSRKMKKNT
tara:strand:+ start:263 stop:682 length:420 start_codon:yes stop_codon:yes gene_type:complete